MMEENNDKDIRLLVKETGVLQPTPDFSKKIMDEVQNTSSGVAVVYQPLISKKIWMVIGLSICVILIMPLFVADGSDSLLQKIAAIVPEIGLFGNMYADLLLNKITAYGLLCVSIMLFVQLFLMRRRIDQDFAV